MDIACLPELIEQPLQLSTLEVTEFGRKLLAQKDRIDCSHEEFREVLGGIPRSTYNAYISGTRTPSEWHQVLILFKAEAEPTRRPQPKLLG